LGRKPKFAFGTKSPIKDQGMDVPGPGTYANVFPPKNHNYAYWIGTDIRRDPTLENSKTVPGPGHYINGVHERRQGPYVGFTKEKKVTTLELSDEPGPGSYLEMGSVGVLPSYGQREVNPLQLGRQV
jgi:hypothetical protein